MILIYNICFICLNDFCFSGLSYNLICVGRDLKQKQTNKKQYPSYFCRCKTDFCSFHLDISHCDAPRAHSSLSRITVTNLLVQTVDNGISCLR